MDQSFRASSYVIVRTVNVTGTGKTFLNFTTRTEKPFKILHFKAKWNLRNLRNISLLPFPFGDLYSSFALGCSENFWTLVSLIQI